MLIRKLCGFEAAKGKQPSLAVGKDFYDSSKSLDELEVCAFNAMPEGSFYDSGVFATGSMFLGLLGSVTSALGVSRGNRYK